MKLPHNEVRLIELRPKTHREIKALALNARFGNYAVAPHFRRSLSP